jgi:tetratricopeptide (TPR) repeat protein
VADDIRVLTAELAADPTSLVFLKLGEALRRDGRLEAAAKVALQGLSRYAELPAAHDLYARVLADQGDFERAFDEWDITLRLDPAHPGAHKGIGFLYFTAQDYPRALEHLEYARTALPDDPSLEPAVRRVRSSMARPPASPPATGTTGAPQAPEPGPAFAGLPGGSSGLLLVDAAGRRLDGRLRTAARVDVSDEVAAELAGVSREASRASRLLELGDWESLAVETDRANYVLVPPTGDTLLLVARDATQPMGRVALTAVRAARAARDWLEAGA